MTHKSYKSNKEPFTFDFAGQPVPPFTARGGLGGMVLELGELAKLRDMQADTPEGMAAISTIFEMLLGPVEYKRFRAYVAAEGIDQDVLLELLNDLFVAVVGHPLGPPPDSPSGPLVAPRTYKVISASDGTVRELPLTPEMEAELTAATIAAMEADLIPGES
jgi:hypothetical protein